MEKSVTREKYRIDTLDGLRGVAALIVLLGHASNLGIFLFPNFDFRGLGKSGVYLFFLLSSFLLARPLLDLGPKIFSARVMLSYWQRRFFRIYPLYFMYLLLAFVSSYIAAAVLNRSDFGVPFYLSIQDFIRHLLLIDGKGVTWSIVVEFKFYAVLPFLAFVLSLIITRFNHFIAVGFLLILVGVLQIAAPQYATLDEDLRLLPYMPMFLTGVLLAVVQNYFRDNPDSSAINPLYFEVAGFLGLIGVILLSPSVASNFAGNVGNDMFHREFLLYSFTWGLVLSSAVNGAGVIRSLFCLKPLRFLGNISFSLYLFHIIFVYAVDDLTINTYLKGWLILVLSISSSFASYRLVEIPLSRLMIPLRGKLS